MNYDHAHHAGNHADVLKHLALIALLKTLSKKPTPWCFLDTHAGSGIYDLSQSKTLEYQNGINKLAAIANQPPLIKEYLAIVASCNQKESIEFYPGSTYIAKKLLRPNDKIIACELNENIYLSLKKNFSKDKKIAVHHVNGYHALKAFLPLQEKRGLVLIDPCYEEEQEWKDIITNLVLALKKWRDGIFAIWYPIKNYHQVKGVLRNLRHHVKNEILIIEMCPLPPIETKLYGSGMIIINPPWQFSAQFEQILTSIWNSLTINKQGYFRQLSIDSVVK